MNKGLKLLLKIVGIVLFIVFVFFLIKQNTKSYSPEQTVSYEGENGLKLEIFYNSPYKKGRHIFGDLVPYNKVWRTGANEATTFVTNKDLMIDGSFLPAGKYTLWTIPKENSWKIIFNSKMYPWGIDLEGNAYRDPKFDTLILETNTNHLQNKVEQLAIYFEDTTDFVFLIITWDTTSVSIPIKEAS
ncbi:DUF2911 domain-containing protein [Zunongwangia sp.]|uniref:DUF2911 domain-containing protein n=1 Tax=Zunongwangia sp. TaxID=1965325 RepID=UPI003AA7BE44